MGTLLSKVPRPCRSCVSSSAPETAIELSTEMTQEEYSGPMLMYPVPHSGSEGEQSAASVRIQLNLTALSFF